jgi:hypothetical protein
MKNPVRIPGMLALVLAGILAGHPVVAQTLLDTTVGGMAVGGATELGSVKQAAPPGVIIGNLQRQGYTNIDNLTPAASGGPMHATATAPGGTRVKLTIDPLTGQLVGVTPY